MQSLTGFVLSFVKYGDSDAVVQVFTKENGYETFFLKGIFSAKNRKKSFLQPLYELQFLVRKTNASGMTRAAGMEAVAMAEAPDIKAMSVIFFTAELLSRILKNEGRQTDIYQLISALVAEIAAKNNSAHFVFLIQFLKISGFAPLVSAGNFLDPESGIFKDKPSGQSFNAEISAVWKAILDNPNSKIQVNAAIRAELLDSILLYFKWHYADFRVPKSLDVMRQFWL